MTDQRPADCRQRLIDEGKAYPKSSCLACGLSVFAPGFGENCASYAEKVEVVVGRERTPSEQIRYLADKLGEQLGPAQSLIDGTVIALRQAAERVQQLEVLAHPEEREGPQPPALEDWIGIGWRALLPSSSFAMTIVNFVLVEPKDSPSYIERVTCAWHDDEGRPHFADYPPGALRIVPPSAN